MQPIISSALLFIFVLYAVSVAIFIIRENRSPQSTFAWLFFFYIFPGGGVLIYLFFGRDHRPLSYQNRLTAQAFNQDPVQVFATDFVSPEEIINRVTKGKGYRKKLLELARRNSYSVLTIHNDLEILQDAQAKYPRLLEDLGQAQQSIHIQYYIWTDDTFTQEVKRILIDRAKAGVEVRCLYDAVGGKLSAAYLRDLREVGVVIHPYLPYQSLFKLHTINYRSHRKIVVIDGKIGYMGGLNLDKDQLDGGKYFDCWRDTHLRIVGEAATILQTIFLTSWYNTTQEKLRVENYFPDSDQKTGHWLPIQITISGPDSEWRAVQQLYFFMISAAEKKVYIQSPFFIPDESIADALTAAALSGVDVKIMCAPRGTTYTLPYWAANTYFQEMARAGVRIFLYQKGYFHPKTINVDAAVCSIGTANMDIRSFSINYEVNAVIYDEATAKSLEQDFLNDLQYCTEFTLEEYQQRNVLLRFRDSLARLASPLL